MNTLTKNLQPSKKYTRVAESNTTSAESTWKTLYRVGAVAALVMLALIPIQSFFFIIYPPPNTVVGYFTLFQNNWLLGLLSLDLLLSLNTILLILVYLALYAALRRTHPSFMAIALTLGLVGIVLYLVSREATFTMLSLSNQYASATTDAQRAMFLAAGQTLLAVYNGTAFDLSYVLGGVAPLMMSIVMLQGNVFSKVTAYIGILMSVLMIIPPTVGMIGLLLSLISLIPLALWLILLARRLFQLAKEVSL